MKERGKKEEKKQGKGGGAGGGREGPLQEAEDELRERMAWVGVEGPELFTNNAAVTVDLVYIKTGNDGHNVINISPKME